MNHSVNIAQLLKQRRSEAGMSQKEISTRCDINPSTYGAYEEGRATPNIHLLMKIAMNFGFTSLDEFLDDGLCGTFNLPIVRAYYSSGELERKVIDRILNIEK